MKSSELISENYNEVEYLSFINLCTLFWPLLASLISRDVFITPYPTWQNRLETTLQMLMKISLDDFSC